MEPIPESVEAMHEFEAALGDEELLEELRRVSTQVEERVPDCLGLSVALIDQDIVLTLVATDASIAVLDAMQYLFAGPCVEAVRVEQVIELNGEELLDEQRWRTFARATAASPVASTLTMPIVTDGHVVGSVNLYAASGNAFTGLHEDLAQLFGAWAEAAVTNADLSWSTRKQAEDAPRRLRERALFETAVGVLAAREELSVEAARNRLIGAAQQAGVSLARIAESVIKSYGG